jgi:hemophore-related protein
MSLSRRSARPVVAGAIGAGAITSAMFFGAALAVAEPPPPNPLPPGCTAADLAGVSAGVSAATSTYLHTHPDVNAFFTGLKGQPKSELRDDVQNYMNANPQVRDELTVIRQPLIDLKERCGSISGAPQ